MSTDFFQGECIVFPRQDWPNPVEMESGALLDRLAEEVDECARWLWAAAVLLDRLPRHPPSALHYYRTSGRVPAPRLRVRYDLPTRSGPQLTEEVRFTVNSGGRVEWFTGDGRLDLRPGGGAPRYLYPRRLHALNLGLRRGREHGLTERRVVAPLASPLVNTEQVMVEVGPTRAAWLLISPPRDLS